ncbi:hypothetical protein DWG94_19865 [Escherichia coli]|nr:hypothetical protein [Escherichia coli]EFO1579651.1 hypothetical protein [Escherichia coli]
MYRIQKWLVTCSQRKKVLQYALDEPGVVTLNKAPASFDLIDGVELNSIYGSLLRNHTTGLHL